MIKGLSKKSLRQSKQKSVRTFGSVRSPRRIEPKARATRDKLPRMVKKVSYKATIQAMKKSVKNTVDKKVLKLAGVPLEPAKGSNDSPTANVAQVPYVLMGEKGLPPNPM